MTIEDSVALLRRKFPAFSARAAYDVDSRGEDFCEIVMPSEKNSALPITVTVKADGCLLSVGRIHNVMGKTPISVEACISAITDVIEDRIVFVWGYKNDDDYADSKTFMARFFALTGRDDDMSEEYEDFLLMLERKPNWFERKFTDRVGVFELHRFSDSEPKIIKRL